MNIKTVKHQMLFVGAGLFVNLLLFFIKLYIGLSSNSISIYADSLNNCLDSAGCAAALFGLGILGSKLNSKYPYGYGRAQDITDFLISISISVTGIYFGYISLERLIYTIPVWYTMKYAVVIAATAMVKLLLALLFSKGAKLLDSSTLRAMSFDSIIDFFVTVSTLVSLTLSQKIGFSLDGIAGMLIAVAFVIEGIKMLEKSGAVLLGKRNDEKCNEIAKLIESYDVRVISVNSHSYGSVCVYTVQAEPCDMRLDEIENRLKNEVHAEIYFRFGENNE